MLKANIEYLDTPKLYDNARRLMASHPMGALMSPTVERYWETRDKMISEIEDFARSWCERRHDANRSASDVLKKASQLDGNARVSDSIRLMNEWFVDSLKRMSEDAQHGCECYARCLGYLSQGGQLAGQETLQQASDAAQAPVKNAAKKAS